MRSTDRNPRPAKAVKGLAAVVCALLVLPLLHPGVPGPAPLAAQSVEDRLRVLAEENAERYLAPLSDGLAHALTGGSFDSPRTREAFSFDLGVRAFGAVPGDAARHFTVLLPDTVRWESPQGFERTYTDPYRPADGSLQSPSAMGEGPGIVLEPDGSFREDLILAGENPDDYRLVLPDGLDVRAVPTAVLGLSVGIGFGTEVSARYLPRLQVSSEVGRVGVRGWGVQHMVSRWFDSPLDVSLGIGRQEMELSGLFEATASESWLLVGRTLGPLTLFGTAGLRRASVDVEYEIENPDNLPGRPADGSSVRFSSDLDSTTAFGGGFKLQLLLMNLSGQYTAGDFDTFSVKVGLGVP